jgi:hypothetical protein
VDWQAASSPGACCSTCGPAGQAHLLTLGQRGHVHQVLQHSKHDSGVQAAVPHGLEGQVRHHLCTVHRFTRGRTRAAVKYSHRRDHIQCCTEHWTRGEAASSAWPFSCRQRLTKKASDLATLPAHQMVPILACLLLLAKRSWLDTCYSESDITRIGNICKRRRHGCKQ